MKRMFSMKGYHLPAFEQETTVTIQQKKDVPVEIGDEVLLLMRAKVENVLGEGGGEINLGSVTPVKVVEVIRAPKEKKG